MALAHQFAEEFDVSGLESSHRVDGSLALANHVLGAFEGDWVFDSALDVVELGFAQLCQVLQVRAYGTQLLYSQFALSHAVVIGAGIQFMRGVGIGDNHFDALQFDGHEFEVERIAIQVDSMIFLTLRGGELVHDTAVDTCELMLAELANLSQFSLVITGSEDVIESTSSDHFDGGRRTQTGTCGDVTPDENIPAVHYFETTLQVLCNAAQRVVYPAVAGQGCCQLIQAQRNNLRHIQRLEAHLFFIVLGQQHVRAETQGARKNMPAVVVGMLANKVNTTRCKIHFLCLLIIRLSKSLSQFIQFHDIYFMMFVAFLAS